MMRLPFKRDFDTRLADAKREKELFDKEAEIRDVKKSMRRFQKPAFSKLMMVVIFAVCIEIIIFSEFAMIFENNLDALYALIGVPVAMFGSFWSYCSLSKIDHQEGGITYELAMREAAANDDNLTPVELEDDEESVG